MVTSSKLDDIQRIVLGTLFTFPDSIPTVIELIRPEYFDSENKRIYQCIVDLFQIGTQIDRVSVYDKTKTDIKYLSSLEYFTNANIELHCRMLIEKSIKRDLNKLANEIIQNDNDVFELIEQTQTRIFDITQRGIKKQIHIKESILQVVDDIEQMKSNKESTIIKTGLSDLDFKLGGLRNGELYVIAARPSIGKTALALKIAEYVSHQHCVLFDSLEMNHKQLSTRLLSSNSKLQFNTVLSGRFNNENSVKVSKAAHKIMNYNLFVDDSAIQSIVEIRSTAKRFKVEKKLKLLIVDYLQLCKAKAESREREIGIISQGLKSIAKELNIPVLALSQLNRGAEARGDKKPQLSDLRESGAIEQDADVVLLLHRPEHYGIDTHDDGTITKDNALVIIAKNRNGATGEVKLHFNIELAEFGNYVEERVKEDVF